MTEPELREHIGRAVTDIIDSLFTYAAEQVALAVTPGPAAGEPEQDAYLPCGCRVKDHTYRGEVSGCAPQPTRRM